MARLWLLLAGTVLPFSAWAFETVPVTEQIYALVGDLGQRSPENLGHNMTSGFVIGEQGVAVVDSGGSRANAEAIHAAVRAVTERPVRWVINTGGQDHRWFGNEYFAELGATLIASERGIADMRERMAGQSEAMERFIGSEAFQDTRPKIPEDTVAERRSLDIGGKTLELIPTAGAHTPGDMMVWLPDDQVLFAGDVVYVERLLAVLPVSEPLAWIDSLERIRDELQPEVIIPGHGGVTDVDEALQDSHAYLVVLRDRVQARIDEGAFDPVEASQGLEQSEFSYLANWEMLSLRSGNAMRMAETLFPD